MIQHLRRSKKRDCQSRKVEAMSQFTILPREYSYDKHYFLNRKMANVLYFSCCWLAMLVLVLVLVVIVSTMFPFLSAHLHCCSGRHNAHRESIPLHILYFLCLGSSTSVSAHALCSVTNGQLTTLEMIISAWPSKYQVSVLCMPEHSDHTFSAFDLLGRPRGHTFEKHLLTKL